VFFAILVMIALYLQQVDVSLVFIKKWFIQKQQAQLNSFFMSQEDAVVLFSKDDKAQKINTQ